MKWLWLVVGIIVISGIFYSLNHKSTNNSSTSTTTPTALEATTTTYTNNTYGFAFDYPKTYGTTTVIFSGKDVSDPTDLNARFEGSLSPIGLTVEVDAKDNNFSSSFFNSQFIAEKKERANANFKLSTTTIPVGGVPSFAVEGIGQSVKEEEILIDHGSYIYSIGYSLPKGQTSDAIQTILNSFRFTK